LNIRLNSLGSVSWHFSCCPTILLGFSGQAIDPIWSARKRPLHSLQSTIGSANPLTCPLASHTFGFMMIAQSTPTISTSRPSGPIGGLTTMSCHHKFLMFRFSSTPSGP
jgi:hypothetical protein